MKKLFMLPALAILGLSTIGCNEKKAAPAPTPPPGGTAPADKDKGETPSTPGDTAKEGEAK